MYIYIIIMMRLCDFGNKNYTVYAETILMI